MKIKNTAKRTLSTLLVMCVLLSTLLSPVSVFAWQASEGQTCSSRYGRNVASADGGTYYPIDGMPIMLYDTNGNTHFDTFHATGKPYALMYLYTSYNTDEQWALCVEAGTLFSASTNSYTSANSENSRYFANLPRFVQQGIMLVSLYGERKDRAVPIAGITRDDWWMAGQMIAWEFQQQLRTSPTSGLRANGPIPANNYYRIIQGRPAELAYNWILQQMADHAKVPTFASNDIFTAPTHTMRYDVNSGKYKVTLMDESGLNIDVEALAANGISVTRNENQYTFTTANIINNPITMAYRKAIPNDGEPLLIWGRPGYQTMCTGVQDPIRFYMAFETESVGTLKIVKKADSDVSVGGWQFRIKGNGIEKEVTVSSDGTLSVPGIIAGRYEISEINVPDYYQKPTSQIVDVIPGQTTEVQFYNRFLKGGLTIQKSSDLDKMTAGVQFRVSGVCDNGTTYSEVHSTDDSGRIELSSLYIGTYTITELGLPSTGIPSWIAAPDSQVIRVNSGASSTASFHNSLKRGNLEIQKLSEDGQFVEGIGFRVFGTSDCGEPYDQTFYTNEEGIVNVPDLLVGTYFVQELEDTVNSNYYVAATQVVAIKFNETTTTQPYNKLKRVPLRIQKESYNGKNLEEIQFLVKGTTATGFAWEHIYTTDSNGVIEVAERDVDAPPCGTYTITELASSVNIGYIIPTEKHETFTYGDKVELYFYNAPKVGSLRIIKTDDLENHFVDGREFRLTGTSYSGDEINLVTQTDSAGVAEILEVPIGEYLLLEENVPAFFVKPEPGEVKVVYAQTAESDVENIAKRTDLHIVKTSTDMQAIEGVPFRVVGIPLAGEEFAYDQTFYTDATGKITIKDLLIGNYSVMELESNVTIGYLLPGAQNVTLEYGNPVTVNFFNKLIQNDIVVYKYDGENNAPLEGVLFGLFDADGKEVARGRSGLDGKVTFPDIRFGEDYTVRELEGLIGYYPQTIYPHFSVVDDGIEQTIPIKNDRIPCKISVYKTDGFSKEPLAGAVFGLFDLDGNCIEQVTTDSSGYAHFAPKVWGQEFNIKEISVPEGYLLSDKVEDAIILPGDTEFVFEFCNERRPIDITLHKVDGYDMSPMVGVDFALYNESGDMLQSGKTDSTGSITFSGLVWGEHVQIRELSELVGYLPMEPIDVTIQRTDTHIDVKAVNNRRPVEIIIHKVDSKTKAPLPGAEFGLYDDEGNLLQTSTSDSAGIVHFDAIWGQSVSFKEITPPEGYLLSQEDTNIKLTPESNILEYSAENSPIQGNVHILKVDADTGMTLSGVEFAIFSLDGCEVGRGVTDQKGQLTFSELRYNSYVIYEVASLDGYKLSEDPIMVAIQSHDETVELTVKNQKLSEPIPTGDNSMHGVIAILAAISAACAFCIYMDDKKHGR